jgi:hypothetical protein
LETHRHGGLGAQASLLFQNAAVSRLTLGKVDMESGYTSLKISHGVEIDA